jgi:hypothetical protein
VGAGVKSGGAAPQAWLALAAGAVLLASIVVGMVELRRRPKVPVAKITIGTRDEVYYSHAATAEEARALGRALQVTGFFRDQGSSVLFWRNKGVPTVSFVVKDGGWDHAATVAGFEEIGRRIAPAIGGFPIQVDLTDGSWNVHKSVAVGKVVAGTRDSVYYLGSASESDATALAKALRDAGYLQDLGATVVLARDGGTSLGFVVGDRVWERPELVASFEALARHVAGSVGGLPLGVRLIDAGMETRREWSVK